MKKSRGQALSLIVRLHGMKAIIFLLVVSAIVVILRHRPWESYVLTYISALAGAYVIARARRLLWNQETV